MIERGASTVAVLSGRAAHQADPIVPPHHHDVDDLQWKVVVDGIALRDVTNANVRIDRDAAGHRLHRSENRPEDRRLAGAVRTDETEEIAGWNVERPIRKHHATPVSERRVAKGD